MEIITSVFFLYLELLGSWWWWLLGGAASISTVIILLSNDDERLSLLKSLQLSIVGVLSLVPIIRNAVSWKLRMDFVTRWSVLSLGTFCSFVLTAFTLSFLLAPLAFIICTICFGLRFFDYAMSSYFGYDVGVYGVINAVRLMFGANPKSIESKRR